MWSVQSFEHEQQLHPARNTSLFINLFTCYTIQLCHREGKNNNLSVALLSYPFSLVFRRKPDSHLRVEGSPEAPERGTERGGGTGGIYQQNFAVSQNSVYSSKCRDRRFGHHLKL